MKTGIRYASVALSAMMFIAWCSILVPVDAQESIRDHSNDRREIAAAFSQGRSDVAIVKIDNLLSASRSGKNPILRRLDLLRDVAIIIHATGKSGLAQVAAELRKIPSQLDDRSAIADAWAQVGEIEERLLDEFETAKVSYRNSLTHSADNTRAKSGLERIAARERLSLRFQREQEAMRAGRLN